jgi:GntR family transcriptional regulator
VAVPDYSDPRPAYVQIADDLRAQIKAGQLAPGAKLPSQRELTDRYQVAGGTVRSALDELFKEGVIVARSTLGTFVAKVPGEPVTIESLNEQVTALKEEMRVLTDQVKDAQSIEGLAAEVAELRSIVGLLQTHLRSLYDRLGHPYPRNNDVEQHPRHQRKTGS